jgi:hypothetical protein
VRTACVGACLACLLATGTAHAQTDSRFAVGPDFAIRAAPDEQVQGSKGIGIVWRFGHGHTGWGWHWGLGWYATDVDQPIGSRTVDFGELHIRPVMAGYGYTYAKGKTSITADVLAGPALVSMTLAPGTSDVYAQQLGAHSVSTVAALTLVARPEVGIWRDINDKIGLHVSAGFIVARPTVGIETSLGEERRRIRADMLQLRVGFAYAVF